MRALARLGFAAGVAVAFTTAWVVGVALYLRHLGLETVTLLTPDRTSAWPMDW